MGAKIRRVAPPVSGSGLSGGAVALPAILNECLDTSARNALAENRRRWATVDYSGELADVGFTLLHFDDTDSAWKTSAEIWKPCLDRSFPLVVDVDRGTQERLIWDATVRERTLPDVGIAAYAIQLAGPAAWSEGPATSLEPIGLVVWVRAGDVMGIIEYSSLGTTGDVIAYTRLLVDAAQRADRAFTSEN